MCDRRLGTAPCRLRGARPGVRHGTRKCHGLPAGGPTRAAPARGNSVPVEGHPDLGRLREQIAALDREVLETLNRRLELVARVQEHKQETGAPLIDAEREAALLQELSTANRGPLSERAVQSVFAAVLDVMK